MHAQLALVQMPRERKKSHSQAIHENIDNFSLFFSFVSTWSPYTSIHKHRVENGKKRKSSNKTRKLWLLYVSLHNGKWFLCTQCSQCEYACVCMCVRRRFSRKKKLKNSVKLMCFVRTCLRVWMWVCLCLLVIEINDNCKIKIIIINKYLLCIYLVVCYGWACLS